MMSPNSRLQDFLSAVLFAVIGVGAVVMALEYPFGTMQRIGPGALPLVFGCLLIAAGILLGVQTWLRRDDGSGPLVRAPRLPESQVVRAMLFISLSLAAFALLIRPMGLFAATAALAVIARQAERGATILGTIIVAFSLALVCSAIFVWGIGLPFRVWPI